MKFVVVPFLVVLYVYTIFLYFKMTCTAFIVEFGHI